MQERLAELLEQFNTEDKMLARIAELEEALRGVPTDEYAVRIEYTHGHVLVTCPLTSDHASAHAATVLTYPTVRRAAVVRLAPTTREK